MSIMHNPPSPGETLREDILPALGLSVTKATEQLKVRPYFERAAISPEMALKIEGWLDVENGGSADLWIAQHAAYSLWSARKAGLLKVKRADMQVQVNELTAYPAINHLHI